MNVILLKDTQTINYSFAAGEVMTVIAQWTDGRGTEQVYLENSEGLRIITNRQDVTHDNTEQTIAPTA
jgi:hypothetical protein